MQGRIVFATGNAGKIKEIRMIMEDTGMEVVSMKDAGIRVDIEENGQSYEENALIKARAVAAFTKDIVMADDSGLEIDYLNKEPGIYSARYLGEGYPVFCEKRESDKPVGRCAGRRAYRKICLCHRGCIARRAGTDHESHHRGKDRL